MAREILLTCCLMGWEVVVLGKLKDMKCAVMESRDEHSAVKL